MSHEEKKGTYMEGRARVIAPGSLQSVARLSLRGSHTLHAMPRPEPEVPPLPLLMTLGGTLAVSALTNCALLAALLKRHRTGLESLLVQLSVTDIAQAITKTIEIWTYNSGQWIYGTKTCASFKGLDIFFRTASIYLTIVLSLHSIALTNIEQKAIKSIDENINMEFDDEEKSSRHSLMASSSDSSTPPRSMNIKRGISNSRSSVVLPSVFAWILAASLSFPEFVLSTTTRSLNGLEICSLVDAAFHIDVDTIIAATFNLLLPILLISLITRIVIRKIKSSHIFTNDTEILVGLRLSLCLCIIFHIMCVFNLVVAVMSSYSIFVDNEQVARRLRPIGLASSALYLVATIVRPCIVINVIPRLQKVFDLRPRTSIISCE